jgi:intracellular multiplication protein IcmJ
MELLAIKLTAKKDNWQQFMARKTNKNFLALKEKIFERDNYTCRYCGFESKKFQEVLNIDQNYANNVPENLATACNLCAPCFFLDGIGMDGASGGTIVYLPEISQADVNHFCRTLFCSLLRDTPYKGKLQSAYLSLLDRAQVIETVFGPDAQDPMVFGRTLIDAALTPAQENNPIFKDLKLVPNRKYFKNQAEYWKATTFSNIPL